MFRKNKPVSGYKPEIVLADKYIRFIPETGSLSEEDFQGAIDTQSQHDIFLFKTYAGIVLKNLQEDGLLERIENGFSAAPRYQLTRKGKKVKDKGYLETYQEEEALAELTRRADSAQKREVIHKNRIKWPTFFIACVVALVAVLTFWLATRNSTPKEAIMERHYTPPAIDTARGDSVIVKSPKHEAPITAPKQPLHNSQEYISDSTSFSIEIAHPPRHITVTSDDCEVLTEPKYRETNGEFKLRYKIKNQRNMPAYFKIRFLDGEKYTGEYLNISISDPRIYTTIKL